MAKLELTGNSIEELEEQIRLISEKRKNDCNHKRKKGGHAFVSTNDPKLMKCDRCGTIVNISYIVDSPEEFAKLADKLVSNMEFLKAFDKSFEDKGRVRSLSLLIDTIYEVVKRHRKTSKKVKGGNKNNNFADKIKTIDRSFDPKEALMRDIRGSKNKGKNKGNGFFTR